MSKTTQRFVALDVHKHYVVGAVNAQQEVVLHPRWVSFVQFYGWAARHLRPTDAVVPEATTNAWYIHDLLQPLVSGPGSLRHPFQQVAESLRLGRRQFCLAAPYSMRSATSTPSRHWGYLPVRFWSSASFRRSASKGCNVDGALTSLNDNDFFLAPSYNESR